MNRKTSRIITKIVVTTVCALLGGLATLRSDARTPRNTETATVNYVVDGDTLAVELGGKRERLRLIGIDTPESFDDEKAHRQAKKKKERLSAVLAKGQQATEYLKSVVSKGDSVTLEFDNERRDDFGRVLGYVYLKSGEMLNLKIIRAGYAVPQPFLKNSKHKSEFKAAYREARKARRGLWSNREER